MRRGVGVGAAMLAASGVLAGAALAGAGVETGFGDGGRVSVPTADRLYPLLRPGGDILAMGVEYGGTGIRSVFRVDQLDERGERVGAFGDGGTARHDVSALDGFDELVEPAGAALLPDGRLVVQSPSSVGNHLAMLTPEGALDPSFDDDGFAADSFQGCGLVTELAYSAVDDTIVSVSHELSSERGYPPRPNECRGTVVRKYTTEGDRLGPWGNAAANLTAHDGRYFAGSVAVDGAGRVILAGVSETNQVAVARLGVDGNPDPTFGDAGLVTFEPAPVPFEAYFLPGFPRIMENKYAADVAVDAEGRIVVAGGSRREDAGDVDLWAARLGPDGQLDPSFGSGGVAWADAGGADDWGLAVDVDDAGRVVVSGASRAPGGDDRRQLTVRFDPTGALDTHNGAVLTTYDDGRDTVGHDHVVDGDRVVLGGLAFGPYSADGYVGVVELEDPPPPTTTTAPPPPAGYEAVTPLRAFDSRGGAPLGPRGSTTVDVAGALGLSPSEVEAVVLNVTGIDPSAWTWLTVHPAGTPVPLASSINLAPGRTVPNAVIAKVGEDGEVAVYNAAGTTHVAVDVMGYVPVGADYTARSPRRILDTRSGLASLGGGSGPVGPGEGRLVQVGGRGGVPADAGAVVMNVTAVGPTAGGWLSVTPGDVTGSGTSSVNFAGGETVANLVVVRLDDAGRVRIANAGGHAHVLADVVGSVPRNSSVLHGVTPRRVLDTRSGVGAPAGALGAGAAVNVAVAGVGPVPPDATGVVLNVTATGITAPSWVTAYPGAEAMPATSNLNLTPGDTVANLVVATLGADGSVNLANARGSTHLMADVIGYLR